MVPQSIWRFEDNNLVTHVFNIIAKIAFIDSSRKNLGHSAGLLSTAARKLCILHPTLTWPLKKKKCRHFLRWQSTHDLLNVDWLNKGSLMQVSQSSFHHFTSPEYPYSSQHVGSLNESNMAWGKLVDWLWGEKHPNIYSRQGTPGYGLWKKN